MSSTSGFEMQVLEDDFHPIGYNLGTIPRQFTAVGWMCVSKLEKAKFLPWGSSFSQQRVLLAVYDPVQHEAAVHSAHSCPQSLAVALRCSRTGILEQPPSAELQSTS